MIILKTIYFADATPVDGIMSGIYGPGTGPIFLDDVGCSGNETNLFECPHRGFGIPKSWDHNWDAGVVCPQGAVVYCVYVYMAFVPCINTTLDARLIALIFARKLWVPPGRGWVESMQEGNVPLSCKMQNLCKHNGFENLRTTQMINYTNVQSNCKSNYCTYMHNLCDLHA